MADWWIKMRVGLADEPEVLAIADAVEIDPDSVVGKLHRIWAWADQKTVDGTARELSLRGIDRMAGVAGFAKAMQSVGWLEDFETGVRFPRFLKHNKETGKARALDAKRKAEKRFGTKGPARESVISSGKTGQDAGHGAGHLPGQDAGQQPDKAQPQDTHTDNRLNKEEIKKSEPTFTDEDSSCAKTMFSLIQSLDPKAKPPNLPVWANEIRLMRERDGRTHAEISELFVWANSNSFWKSVILSPQNLRKNWTKLTIQRTNNSRRDHGIQVDSTGVETKYNAPGAGKF